MKFDKLTEAYLKGVKSKVLFEPKNGKESFIYALNDLQNDYFGNKEVQDVIEHIKELFYNTFEKQ